MSKKLRQSAQAIQQQMRRQGEEIFNRLMSGDEFKIPVETIRRGKEVAQSKDFGFLRLEELKAKIGEANITWIGVGSNGTALLLPILMDNDGEKVILQFKPYLPIRRWTIDLVGGQIEKGEKAEKAAARELLEETGYTAGKLTTLGTFAPGPFKLGEISQVYVTEDLEFKKKKVTEEYEKQIKNIALTIPEIKMLLDANKIPSAQASAVLYRFLNSREAPSELRAKRE